MTDERARAAGWVLGFSREKRNERAFCVFNLMSKLTWGEIVMSKDEIV